MTATLMIDTNQGLDEQGRKFGYVHTGDEDDGGYFFTWLSTLDATLDSLEADEIDEPSFDEADAREAIAAKIAGRFQE